MTLLYWNNSLSVNVKSMDDQHKKLIDMINDFYDNISNRTNKENVYIVLGAMKAYVLEHFSEEESYMEKFDYDHYLSHKKEHAHFIQKVEEIEKKYNNGEIVLSLELTMFLVDWLKNHIQVSDMKYSDLFVRNGVK